MAFTRINFNQIQGASETPNTINIDKNINFTEQVSIPIIPPSQDTDNVIWAEPNTGTFKSRVNLVNYGLSFKSDFKDLAFGSPDTISLGGNTGIINNLTVSGTNTILNIRSSSIGTVQWSILEIKGNLTIASGCTVNLIRTPLIVRGNISGSGTITSPNGTNGGSAGVGGPGGSGGAGATSNNSPTPAGTNSPSTWPNNSGGSALSMPVEYGINSGSGGPGGRGTAGGGGGSAVRVFYENGGYNTIYVSLSGGSSGNGNPGGLGYPFAQINGVDTDVYAYGAGGGGANGNGQSGTYTFGSGLSSIRVGGSAANATSGTSGGNANTLSMPYIGIGTPSNVSSSSAGTSGGAGGNGALLGYSASGFRELIPLYYNETSFYEGTYEFLSYGSPGSPGGTGGNGGAGGGTGGAHISIYCAGTISSPITIRPGKGGLTGGSTSLPRAQTGSLWLFTINNDPITTDITGATGTPNGPAGVLTRTLISNSSGVSDFFNNILFEPNGLTPAKTKFAVTSS